MHINIKTALISLACGFMAMVATSGPLWAAGLMIVAAVYVAGVVDGRTGRRGGRVPDWIAGVRGSYRDAIRRPVVKADREGTS